MDDDANFLEVHSLHSCAVSKHISQQKIRNKYAPPKHGANKLRALQPICSQRVRIPYG